MKERNMMPFLGSVEMVMSCEFNFKILMKEMLISTLVFTKLFEYSLYCITAKKAYFPISYFLIDVMICRTFNGFVIRGGSALGASKVKVFIFMNLNTRRAKFIVE